MQNTERACWTVDTVELLHFLQPKPKQWRTLEDAPTEVTLTACSRAHARTHIHTRAIYWTLRARAETPWCQSLSSLYFGPITNRVVVLFALTSQDKKEKRDNTVKEEKDRFRRVGGGAVKHMRAMPQGEHNDAHPERTIDR